MGKLVVLVGVAFALVVPGSFDLLGNSQIWGRTSPGIPDLIAAIATGFAGAIALARRDVVAVLPGVAIAISLVPPLAVVGVCFGQGSFALAFGAMVLFVSNLLALVLAGTLVFTAVGYTAEAQAAAPPSRRKAYLTISLLLVVVIIPLVGNTLGTYLVSVWTGRVQATADEWISAIPNATIQGVDFNSNEVFVRVQTPGGLPPVEDLVADLKGEIPKRHPDRGHHRGRRSDPGRHRRGRLGLPPVGSGVRRRIQGLKPAEQVLVQHLASVVVEPVAQIVIEGAGLIGAPLVGR